MNHQIEDAAINLIRLIYNCAVDKTGLYNTITINLVL